MFHPISLVLPKETGWSPKEKRFWGGGAPVRFRDPPASPTRVGGATRPLRCPLRGRIESLAPGARGLGWRKSGPVKVFCPAFLQKSGRGPGAEPWPRAAARGTLLCSQSAGGGQRGNPRRGFPLCGRPKPPAAYARRRGAGGGRRKGSSRTPTPTAGGKRAVCRIIYCEIIRRPGRGGRNAVRLAKTVTAGRRGRRPLQGGCDTITPAVIRRRAGLYVGGYVLYGACLRCRANVCHERPVGDGVLDVPKRGFTALYRQRLWPTLRFVVDRVFRALRRAARGAAPGPCPLFCKKAGQKLLNALAFAVS